MSKDKKQQALEKAQEYISGNKLTKSDVKRLEDKGFSSGQIEAVAGSMKVGDQAQSRIDSKHSSGGTDKVRTVGGERMVLVSNQGRAVNTGSTSSFIDPRGLTLGRQQVDKINDKLDKYGGSLSGGKGMAVSGFVTVTGQEDPDFRYPYQMKIGTGGDDGKYQLPIYSPVSRNKDKGNKERYEHQPATGSSPSHTPAPQERQYQSAYQRAQNHISANTSLGDPPELFPRGISPGRGVEAVANYSDRLGTFNANYSGWMQDRANANRYEVGSFLNQFANITPPAPSVTTGKELLEWANRLNSKIEVG